MFKKTVVLSVAVALVMLGLFVDPSAAQSVTSVSKRGSLLVWPKINTDSGKFGTTTDTIIMIGNDAAKAVTLKCYWMDSSQASWDFELELTPYQPIWFSAKTGWGTRPVSELGDNKTGELKCWAITIPEAPEGALEQLRQFNYLYGNAIIVESDPIQRAFEYNAWAFFLHSEPGELGSTNLDLNGDEYDYCPAYLVYNFFAGPSLPDYASADGAIFGDTTLTLAPCQQDLRQDKTPVCGKAKFDVWNQNEIKFTGAYQCVKCWYEGVLSKIGATGDKWVSCDLANLLPTPGKCKATGVGGSKFTIGVIHTDFGRFRVTPDTWPACKGVFAKIGQDGKTVVDVCAATADQYKTPFLGVRLTDVAITAALPLTDSWAGVTGTAAGAFTGVTQSGGFQPYIKWDRGVNYQTPAR
jgi:hypothetical protein